jgi:PQQ-dependent catabolism-associated CXXCW motif protein
MTRRVAALALAFLAFALASASGQDAAVPEPDGYRLQDYRSPTPSTLKGARVLTTSEAADVWRAGGAVFVDVMPQAPRPAGLPPDTIWRDKPRLNIPGSVWLPDTGYGALADVTEDYLTKGLEQTTGGDQTKMLVFYCQKDCWMSWNAAKRALAMGYRNVAWFPDGSDGWHDASLPLAQAQPALGRPDLTPATAGSPAPAQTGDGR